jgi:hypothetical protein
VTVTMLSAAVLNGLAPRARGRDRHTGSSLKSTSAAGPAITSTMPAKRAARPAL